MNSNSYKRKSRLYKRLVIACLIGVLFGVLIYGFCLLEKVILFQQNIIGILYQENPSETDRYLYAMFEEVSEDNIENAKLALEANGFTDMGLYYISEHIGIWGVGVTGFCTLFLLCLILVFVLRKREQLYEEENELSQREIDQLKQKQMKDEYERKHNERIQCFIENIAHQMKTPLSRVFTSLDIVEDSLTDEVAKRHVEECYTHLDSMNGLMRQLMDIGRLEAGKVLFQKEMFSVKNLLVAVRQSCTAEASRVHINCEDALEYYGDEKWLKEAFVNVLCNALEADKEGEIVEIGVIHSGDFLKVSIRDYGLGICEKDIPNIFDRFYLPENVKENHTGIGLNLAKLVIEGHQGSIYVHNHIDGGTVFQIILPIYESLKVRGQ